jgi:hypothetical protein
MKSNWGWRFSNGLIIIVDCVFYQVYLEQNSHGPFGPFALALTYLPRSCPAMQYINANHFKLGLDALHLPNLPTLYSDIVN